LASRWIKFKSWAAELKAQVVTLWFCRNHPGTPWTAKVMAAMVVAYALSPIDLIPDFIPVLGYVDELFILPLGIYLTLRLIPQPVVKEARAQADAWLAERHAKPRSYWAAGVIILVWLALAYGAWAVVREWL
jgi:uncharacterized membrane protein YkvA (DUF1232 family)